jgi:cytochrome b561
MGPTVAGGPSYGPVPRFLHWTTAALLAIIVSLGLTTTLVANQGSPREEILFVHKSLGLLVLALTAFRLAWMLRSPVALDAALLKPWELKAARIGHVLLYLILFLMPISGIVMSQGAGREVGFFGLNLPQILPLDPGLSPRGQPLYLAGKFMHDIIFQWTLYAILALHMAGVLKHRFIDGDRNFLRRMWG